MGDEPVDLESGLTETQKQVVARVKATRPMPLRPRRFAVERAAWWMAMLVGLGYATAMGAYPIITRSNINSHVFLVLAAVFVTSNLVLGVVPKFIARRRIIKHEGLLCPICHYALGGLPPEGVCPECATRYQAADVRRMWRTSYRISKRRLPD